jgi:hypothetical protein
VLLGFSVINGSDGRMGLTEFLTYVSAPAVPLPADQEADREADRDADREAGRQGRGVPAGLVRYRGVCSHAYCLNARSMARIVARGEPVLRDARRLGAHFPHRGCSRLSN